MIETKNVREKNFCKQKTAKDQEEKQLDKQDTGEGNEHRPGKYLSGQPNIQCSWGLGIKMSKTEAEFSVYDTENHSLEQSDRKVSFVS